MAKHRIYVNQLLSLDNPVELDAAQANHLVNVLRLKEGAEVVLFNGVGGEYHGYLCSAKKRAVQVKLKDYVDENRDSALAVHLGQVMIKGERMDYALQKATELGVAEITPILSERCELRLKGERLEKKVSHWQRVVQSACEQCLRNTVPAIHPPQSLDRWLMDRSETIRWVCHPWSEESKLTVDKDINISDAAVLIGPEGGFTEQEIGLAVEKEFLPRLFGPRVLRAETAPVVALTLLQQQYGDF